MMSRRTVTIKVQNERQELLDNGHVLMNKGVTTFKVLGRQYTTGRRLRAYSFDDYAWSHKERGIIWKLNMIISGRVKRIR